LVLFSVCWEKGEREKGGREELFSFLSIKNTIGTGIGGGIGGGDQVHLSLSAAEFAAYVETLPPLPRDDAGSDEDAVAFPQAGSVGAEDVSAASESRDSVSTLPTATSPSDEEPGGGSGRGL
jgi:hypothetical protein